MKQKTLFISAAALLLLGFVIAALVYKSDKAEQAAQTTTLNREALVRFHSPTIGSAEAPVHIVEFFDPACETCRDFYPLVKEMMAAGQGKIRLTVRYTPFHQGSDQIVQMLEAARKQGKFWQALEALLAVQDKWVLHHTAHPDLAWQYLGDLGLDLEQLRFDMTAPEITRIIQEDLADAKTLNVTKTPEFFVNGKPLPSFGYRELKKLVDDALAQAR